MAAPAPMHAHNVHVLLFPWPLQGHINPMLHLATALLDAGLRVSFLHTDHNLRRLALAGVPPHHPRLRMLSIPDGLPDHHPRSVDGIMDLLHSMRTAGTAAYRALLLRLTQTQTETDEFFPGPVTCVVADGVMPFAVSVAEEVGVPALALRTESASAFLAYLSVPTLLELGEVPAPSDEPVRGVPGMEGFLRRRDLPRLLPQQLDADPVPVLLTIHDTAARSATEARGLVLNTAASMEGAAVSCIAARVVRDGGGGGKVFAVGPLHARPGAVGPASEEDTCTAWLDGHADRSVVYVSMGSLTMVSTEQMAEFLHGLAGAGYPFLCVLRPGMVLSAAAATDDGQQQQQQQHDEELLRLREAAGDGDGTSKRALVVEWSPHGVVHSVLRHRAVGCFLTHAGWNSTLEAAAEGVPVLCWPYFADQQTVSRFAEAVWKTGLDMKDVVGGGDGDSAAVVARMVRQVMESTEIRAAAEAMARQLKVDVAPGGSSASDLERLVAFITELSAAAARQNPSSSPS